MSTTASQTIASPRPTGPTCSPVLALTFTAVSSTPSSRARFARMAGLCGPSFGSWAWMITSQLTARQPGPLDPVDDLRQQPGAVQSVPSRDRYPDSARRCRPGRPRPAGRRPPRGRPRRRRNDPPGRADDRSACPPRISGRPSPSRCVSCPIPTRKAIISRRKGVSQATGHPPPSARHVVLRRRATVPPQGTEARAFCAIVVSARFWLSLAATLGVFPFFPWKAGIWEDCLKNYTFIHKPSDAIKFATKAISSCVDHAYGQSREQWLPLAFIVHIHFLEFAAQARTPPENGN